LGDSLGVIWSNVSFDSFDRWYPLIFDLQTTKDSTDEALGYANRSNSGNAHQEVNHVKFSVISDSISCFICLLTILVDHASGQIDSSLAKPETNQLVRNVRR
jgi:hypothetical protein